VPRCARGAQERRANGVRWRAIMHAPRERVERGVVAPQSPFLFVLIYGVSGDLAQVAELIRDPAAPAATGQQESVALRAWRLQQARWREASCSSRARLHQIERWLRYAACLRDRPALF